MSLTLIATPIGNPKDITLRALEILKNADIIVGEERKQVSILLRQYEIKNKRLELLNEHSRPDEIKDLMLLCQQHEVALVTDCGTPSFCDPGFQLVAQCRQNKIQVTSAPGASSLMLLLSLASEKLQEFLFCGFLPANSEERNETWKNLKNEKRALVIMDTPYRLQKLMAELKIHFPTRRALLGLNLTNDNESIIEGTVSEIVSQLTLKKAEFIILLYKNY